MVKVACYGEMHSTVDNFFAKVLFIFELVCEIKAIETGIIFLAPKKRSISSEWHAEDRGGN